MATDSSTFLEALVARVRKAGDHNRGAVTAPAAILWPDRDRQWEPLLDALRAAMPELLTYGDYAPDLRRGPAIWLRCVLGGTVSQAVTGKHAPVIYLPGVGRSELREVETCPRPLGPLAELQYRGEFFGHADGKDWTVSALLRTPGKGLGLELAEDHATLAALRQVLKRLATVKIEERAQNDWKRAIFSTCSPMTSTATCSDGCTNRRRFANPSTPPSGEGSAPVSPGDLDSTPRGTA